MLLRFRKDVVALRPKAVAILGGINDLRHSDTDATLEDLENNLASMMEIANANGIRVILALVLPIADKDAEKQTANRQTNQSNEHIRNLNAWLRDCADKKGAVFVDLFSAMNPWNGLRARPDKRRLAPKRRGIPSDDTVDRRHDRKDIGDSSERCSV
jgi:lysophospholipase L1-like esterase